MPKLPSGPLDVGFTGTQQGMSPAQKKMLRAVLTMFPKSRFHHGVCIGADEQADEIAYEMGFKMHLHPPTKKDKIAKLPRSLSQDVVYEAKPYLKRNEDIARVDVLIACPKEYEMKQFSGTWSTVRRAQWQNTFAIVVIWPDGTLGLEWATDTDKLRVKK
jgi:hypothetical protein